MGLLLHECPIVRVHFDLQTLGLCLYCHVDWERQTQRPRQIYTPLLWAKISFNPKENNTLVMQMGLKRRNPQSYFMSLLPLEMLPFWSIYLLVVTGKLIPSRARWGNPRLVSGHVYPLDPGGFCLLTLNWAAMWCITQSFTTLEPTAWLTIRFAELQ